MIKKFPKLVQCDKRGQIVIPKDLRRELKIEEGTGFWMFAVTDEGILLKKVDKPSLKDDSEIISEIENKSDKLNVDKKNLKKTVKNYRKTTDGGMDVL